MSKRLLMTAVVLAAAVGLLAISEHHAQAIGAEAPAEDNNPFSLEPDPAPTKKPGAADPFAPPSSPPAEPAAPAADPFAMPAADPFGGGPPATTKPDTRAESKKPTPRTGPLVSSGRRSGEEAILEALDEPSEAMFIETPLLDVLDYLTHAHDVNIIVDQNGLDDAGVADDIPIDLDVAKIPLRSVLALILEPLELTWTIRDGVLLVTSEEEAEQELVAKVYNVADLIVYRDEKDELWEDYDTLIDAIITTLDPDTWQNEGGLGSIEGATFGAAKVLVVRQNYQVHQRVARLLEDLRAVAQKTPGDGKPPLKRRRPPPGYGGGTDGRDGMRGMGGMGGGMF
ncbi:MAG: hypothetical protein HQ582_33855 [Planctomycetes bacterium]|nr:hypothetical protein [Planctomycetota bacterium]